MVRDKRILTTSRPLPFDFTQGRSSPQTRLPAPEAQLMAGRALRVREMNQLMVIDRLKAPWGPRGMKNKLAYFCPQAGPLCANMYSLGSPLCEAFKQSKAFL
jgi:hypothetical protein